MSNFGGLDPNNAVQALIAICGLVSIVIGWLVERRRKAKKNGTWADPTRSDMNAYVQLLLSDRDRREREFAEGLAIANRERDRAIRLAEEAQEDAAEAWKVRESLSTQVARLTERNANMEVMMTALKERQESLLRALRRSNPELFSAFESGHAPLE